MKTTIKTEELLNLEVRTTSQGKKDYVLPIQGIFQWYPFNVNFAYMHSESRNQMYLVKLPCYKGENLYDTEVLKHSEPLEELAGTLVNWKVFQRNTWIMLRASQLGVPKTLLDEYTMEDVKEGYEVLHNVHSKLQDQLYDRLEVEESIYDVATKSELEFLEELGEMYAMLNLMRKIKEGR
ncbi:anti-sigma factor [Bacillus phage Eldridge]|uniref:Uncharacterized protein n=1 Tax=Bacillus phage Eldridge TaxID=1776293 RepID=A0A109QLN4_9CAUD|nr:anti-sigma factor [Bacillus phage Eldridge]AMB18681.1 hypothetical protein Eldridge_0101 [Bacillus phage Eldridge]